MIVRGGIISTIILAGMLGVMISPRIIDFRYAKDITGGFGIDSS